MFDKIIMAVRRFMSGRHGADQLSLALIYTAIALNVLTLLIPRAGALGILSMAMLVFALVRIFSKNHERRYRENAWYVKHVGSLSAQIRQAWTRFKNRKTYLYFDCPQCRAKLRLPRGKGEVTMTCGRCGHTFRKRA